jgi:hypothetical protein
MCGVVQAAEITATFHGVDPGRGVEVSLDGGDTSRETRAGKFNWTKDSGDYDGVDGDFSSFCIELVEQVGNGNQYTFGIETTADAPNTMPPGMGAAKADLLSEYFGRFIDVADMSSNKEMAAFQLGVWEIVYDDGLDLEDGDFRVMSDGNENALAQSWLNALDGSGPRIGLDALVAEGIQDQVVVPEPASLVMALAAMLVAMRRR